MLWICGLVDTAEQSNILRVWTENQVFRYTKINEQILLTSKYIVVVFTLIYKTLTNR